MLTSSGRYRCQPCAHTLRWCAWRQLPGGAGGGAARHGRSPRGDGGICTTLYTHKPLHLKHINKVQCTRTPRGRRANPAQTNCDVCHGGEQAELEAAQRDLDARRAAMAAAAAAAPARSSAVCTPATAEEAEEAQRQAWLAKQGPMLYANSEL
jgi:hypothetical protein